MPDLLYHALEHHSNRAVLQQRLGSGRWRPVSLQELRVDVEDIALGLRALGLDRGDRVVLLSRSDTDFMRVDLGCLLGGLVDVPVYLDLAPRAAHALVEHSGAEAVVVADTELLSRFAPALESTAVRLVVLCRPDSAGPDNIAAARTVAPSAARLVTLAEVCGQGRRRRGEDSEAVDKLRAELAPGDLATVVYTSGTTGQPKGVMLSHQNLSFNALSALEGFPDYRPGEGGEVAISFLPLAHSFQRTLCYAVLAHGTTIYFSGREHLGEDFAFVRPTVFAAVPRVLEKVRERIVARVEERTGLGGRVARWALARAELHDPDRPRGGLERLRHGLADLLVYRKWRAAFGGRVRHVIAGGAAVSAELVDFFAAADVEVLQGYGLTETSPVIAFNRPGRSRSGTVGEPLVGVEVMVSAEGEVLTRGPHVMRGYFRDEAATRAVLVAEGWLRTGDRGSLDETGSLRLNGRLKDDFKLSTGKFVFPEAIERRLERDPLIEHAVVLGAGHPYCVAMLFVDAGAALRWAARAGHLDAPAPDGEPGEEILPRELLVTPPLLAHVREQVARVNEGTERWEQVQRFMLLAGPLSVASGLLTPTLKVRRATLTQRYAAEIAALYEAEPEEAPPSPVLPPAST